MSWRRADPDVTPRGALGQRALPSVRAGAVQGGRVNAELRRDIGFGERSADWKSAIQQVGNLRYDHVRRRVMNDLPTLSHVRS